MNEQLLAALLESLEAREAVALLSVTAGSGEFANLVGHHLLLWLDESRTPVGDLGVGELTERVYAAARDALAQRQHRHLNYTTDQGSIKIFVEVQAQPSHLIIVGAGHIAVPLAAIAKLNDFEVTVIDDRAQFAHPARFPTVERVIAGPFRGELQKLRSNRALYNNHTYIVLVTRGHQYDIESLLEVLDDPVAYIGMIGSQRRIRAVFELLENEQGIPPAKFDRIHAPIGIDIGARTPAEIAVCIMAEIINVMRHGPALTMSEQIRQERLARRQRLLDRARSQ
ncbi:MAG: XdhC family protein [Caldilineaceae bacterium]